MHTQPITDSLLDEFQDELREIAASFRASANAACEDDDMKADHDLAETVEYIAYNRPLLVRFAYMLRNHKTKASALAEIAS